MIRNLNKRDVTRDSIPSQQPIFHLFIKTGKKSLETKTTSARSRYCRDMFINPYTTNNLPPTKTKSKRSLHRRRQNSIV